MSIEDKLYGLLKFYKNLPYPVKNIIGRLYRLIPNKQKYGSFYFLYLDRIKTFQEGDNSKLLKEQIEFALKDIPYYKGKDFNQIEDFPIIDKTIIKSNFNSFVNPHNKNRIIANTGGSSGTPFEFYLEKGISRPKEKAHFDWYWSQFGYSTGKKVLMIRGEALSNNKIFEYQAVENKLAVSCYLLNSTNIKEVLKAINQFKPEFIHAYPSALKNFMDVCKQNGLTINSKIKAIFLGSEGLLALDKTRIENYFKAKVAHWYGHSERLIHAGNCLYSDTFHIFPFYGHVELVDETNKLIMEPNHKGRIIATGFDNGVMPLMRYDTGDEAEYSEEQECKCGFKGRSFKKIHGRRQDYIYLNDKTKVSLTAFIFGQHFEEFALIKEIQLEQTEYGKLIVRVIANQEGFDKSLFVNKLVKSVESKLEVQLIFVDQIPKTARGKQIFLIQKIKNV